MKMLGNDIIHRSTNKLYWNVIVEKIVIRSIRILARPIIRNSVWVIVGDSVWISNLTSTKEYINETSC